MSAISLPSFRFSLSLLIISIAVLLTSCKEPDNSESQSKTELTAEGVEQLSVDKSSEGENAKPFTVIDISARDHKGHNELSVLFSQPLSTQQEYQSWLQVYADNQLVEGGWRLSENRKSLWFSNTQPNTRYLVQVAAKLPSAAGQELPVKVEAEVKTRDLKPTVSFKGGGLFYARGLGKGLPITAVNVDEVNVEFFRINDNETQAFIDHAEYYRGDSWYINELVGKGVMVHQGRYQLEAKLNTRQDHTIDIEALQALQKPGLYMAVMTAPGIYRQEQSIWFMITDIGVHVRFYDRQLLVTANSLASGAAVQYAEVLLLDEKQQLLTQGKTDANGALTLEYSQYKKKARSILVRKGTDYSLLTLRQPSLDLSEFDLGRTPYRPVELFSYSPRDLYRPGEWVDLAALIRDFDGKQTAAPVLNVKVRRPDGSEAGQFSWQPQQLGFYHHQWQLPDSAPLGLWQFDISGPFGHNLQHQFQVEDFMPERLSLDFSPTSGQRKVIDSRRVGDVELIARYLHGASAIGNKVDFKLGLSHWRSPVESLVGFEFGDHLEQVHRAIESLGSLKLDKEGSAKLKIDPSLLAYNSPLRVRVFASVFEAGGRAVNRYQDQLLWPQSALLGVKADFGKHNPPENSQVKFDLLKANLQGELQATEVEVALIREERDYFWGYSESRGWHYQWNDKVYPVEKRSINLTDQAFSIEFPVEWGWYRIEVTEPGSQLKTSKRFHVGDDWYASWQQSQRSDAARPDKVTLAVDKAGYQTGDTIQLQVVPPRNGEAVITVESDQLLWIHRQPVSAEGSTVTIPVADEWSRHDLYISAVVLSGKTQQTTDKAQQTPLRSFGLLHLPLDRSARRLGIEMNLPEKVEPDQMLKTRIRVRPADQDSLSSQTYLTVAAVDTGILSLSGFETPDPYKGFFGKRRYSVDSRDIYHKLIEVSNAPTAKQRFGGDADLVRGGEQARSDIQIVSIFSGLVDVDESGYADVELLLPYFNGQLRVMVLAFDEQRFGHAEQDLVVAAPVISEMSMPRFLAAGDRSQLTLMLANQTDQSQQLNVDLSLGGPADQQKISESVVIEAGQKTHITLPIKVNRVLSGQLDDLSVQLEVKGDALDKPISRQWQLPVRYSKPSQTERLSGVLAAGETLSLAGKTNHLVSESIIASATLSSSPIFSFDYYLKGLLQYPYGCLEQTTSKAVPLLSGNAKIKSYFPDSLVTPEQRTQWLDEAVARILNMQRSDGSFGLWNNRGPEEHWLTVYVTEFLLKAKQQGYGVDEGALTKALERLKYYLRSANGRSHSRWSEAPAHYSFSYKAYAAFVLANIGQAPLGRLRQLYDHHQSDAKSGLPLLHLAEALRLMGDHNRAEQAYQQGLARARSGRYLGDYGSDVRDLAVMSSLAIDVTDKANLISQLTRKLLDQPWLSTQDQAALLTVVQSQQQEIPWIAEMGSSENVQQHQADQELNLRLDENDLATDSKLLNAGRVPLYYQLLVQGQSNEQVKPVSEGIHVSRRYYQLSGEPLKLTEFNVGDLVLVRLDLIAEQRIPDALVVDLLPAGFELENSEIGQSGFADQLLIDGQPFIELLAQSAVKMTEYRDDRYVVALDLSNYGQQSLFYLMRAVTPGQYAVPATLVEDMYRPQFRAVGETIGTVKVLSTK